MNGLFPVMVGGAIGAGARHLIGQVMLGRLGPGFPWWTLSINIAGSLMMGLLIGWLARSGGSDTARLFLGVGILANYLVMVMLLYFVRTKSHSLVAC